jgi:uncharacterized protein YcbX
MQPLMTSIKLSGLFIYPIKSLAGISVNRWSVVKTGLKYDRQWMIVDDSGQFLSQRKLARLALIKTSLTDNELILSAPAMQDLEVPLEASGGETLPVTIWHDRCYARSASSEADQWLSRFLQLDCRLVYQPEGEIRRVDPAYSNATDQVAYSDGFPFLLVSENSLNSLNEAMHSALPMSRFRPNLVVSGCAAFAEDTWREIGIGSIGFRLPKPCSRCVVPTINQETAETGKEPLITLNRMRKWQNKVYFGQNTLHNQCGELSIGDTVYVKSTGPKQPPL